jgi:hypothetical protein
MKFARFSAALVTLLAVSAAHAQVALAPPNVVATPGNLQATIRFDEATVLPGGSPIQHYLVRNEPAGGTDQQFRTTALTHVVVGLQARTTYWFSVNAINDSGFGFAGISNTITLPDVPPDAPTNLQVIPGVNKATLTFGPPSDLHGASAITRYTVTTSPAGGIDGGANTASTTREITGLTNGVLYTFTVTATNDAGTSPGITASGLPRDANVPMTVNSLLDDGVGCTLRNAIENANGKYPPNPGCPVGGFGNTITFSVNGAIKPAGPIAITGSVTVQGNGRENTSIDGSMATRLFELTPSTPATVKWKDLTLRRGFNNGLNDVPGLGSAIYVGPHASATLEDCDVRDNLNARTSAVVNQGALTVRRTTFANNVTTLLSGGAGAIESRGITDIRESTFSGNQGSAAGALHHADPNGTETLTIVNSTFVGNTGNGGAGAISLYTLDAPTVISFTTIAYNTAVSINSGGIEHNAVGSLAIDHTIIAFNTGGHADCSAYNFNAWASGGYNIFGSLDCAASFPSFGPQDLIGDPGLDPFGSYGGPTDTIRLHAGSPAIDRDPQCVAHGAAATDQRGRARPQGGGCESGAFEMSAPDAPTNVTAEILPGSARVDFTPPAYAGEAPITGYTVASIPPGGVDANANTADTRHFVTGLTNGVNYQFVVVAVNSIGTSPQSAPSPAAHFPLPPGAPTNVVVTYTGGDTAVVTFDAAPTDPLGPITGYIVSSVGGNGSDADFGSPSLRHTVSGLVFGVSTAFTVRATNLAGDGPESAPSNTILPNTVPNTPNVQQVIARFGQASVEIAGFSQGTPITGYTVYANPAGPIDSNAGSAATTHIVTGLQAGVTYTFTVIATNAAGDSAPSAPSREVTWSDVPFPPVMVAATVFGTGQAVVGFNPELGQADYPTTGYKVYSDPPGGVDIDAGAFSFNHVVTGLTPGVTYTFTARGINQAGEGRPSAPSNPLVMTGPPGAPTGVTVAYGTAPFSVTVSFTAPPNNGAAITSYRVTGSPGAADSSGISVSTTHTIVNLNPGTPYTFTVRARNAMGEGPSSAASASITVSATPAAPLNVRAVAGNAQATVSFDPPPNNGSPAVTRYLAVANPDGWQVQGTSSPLVVPNLTNGRQYTFRVIAFNAFGTGLPSDPSNAVTPQAVTTPTAAVPFDFDGNGCGDIVIRDSSTGVEYGWLMNGLSITNGGYLLDAGSGWRVIKSADFNGDGKADLLIQHTDGSAYIRLMDGLTVIGGGYLLGAGTGYTVTQVADFNGDGKADVLMRHSDGSIYIQTMDGITATAGTFLQGAGSGWTVTHVADFNGDGKSDILMKHADGSIYVQLMDGITAIDGTYLLGAGSGWSPTVTGDFNGDHKADILITHDNGGVYLWQMNGTTLVTGTYLLSPGSGWSIAETADLDGDGKSDILIEHADGSLYAWMMDGLNVVNGAYLLGAGSGWSLSHVRDLDGDGKSDILIEHSDGSIYGWIMNGATITNGTYLQGAGTWSVSP